MKRKGSEIPIGLIVLIVVLLVVVLATYFMFQNSTANTKNKIGGVDPSSGSNQAKTDDCTKKCNEAPKSDACMNAPDPDPAYNGMTCRTYLDNLAKSIEVNHPEKIGSTGANRISLALTSKGSPISETQVAINGPYILEPFSPSVEAPNVYVGTIDATKVPLSQGKGYVSLTVSVAGYPSVPVSILVDDGAPVIFVDSNTGGGTSTSPGAVGSIILKDVDKKVMSVITLGKKMFVWIKGIPDDKKAVELKLVLKKDGEDKTSSCGVGLDKDCTKIENGNEFTVPVAALADGAYSLEVSGKESSASEVQKRTFSFSWKCPAVVLDKNKPFGAGKEMVATFESHVYQVQSSSPPSASDEVTVSLNTHLLSWKKDPTSDNGVSFTIPKLNDDGMREGTSNLRVEREGIGLCIKHSEASNSDIVINFIDTSITWSCSANGCYTDDTDSFNPHKEYVLSGNGYGFGKDSVTGCEYTTKNTEACPANCKDGACAVPKLTITSIKLDGVDTSSKMYWGAKDRIITVTVKNAGTLKATEVYSGITANFDSTSLDDRTKMGIGYDLPDTDPAGDPKIPGNLNELAPGNVSEYYFTVDAALIPEIPLSKTSVTSQISVTATVPNGAPAALSQSVTFYSCGLNCPAWDTDLSCNACSSSCVWKGTGVTPSCRYKCGEDCSSKDKLSCADCSVCTWDLVTNKCYSVSKPSAPTLTVTVDKDKKTITLSWTKPLSDKNYPILGYNTCVSGASNMLDHPVCGRFKGGISVRTFSFSYAGVSGTDATYYTVSAINAAGEGEPSNIGVATVT